MKLFTKITAAVAAPLLLSGCLFLPGKFDSTLELKKDGSYAFSYNGEMQIFSGDEKDMKPPVLKAFDPENARCNDWIEADGSKTPNSYYDSFGDSTEEAVEVVEIDEDDTEAAGDADAVVEKTTGRVKRECTSTELADLKQQHIDTFERRQKDYEQRSEMVAQMFGGAIPGNDEALKEFASTLMKYDGWNKVEYVGENMFNVEYSATGTFDRYFAFPILNDAAMQYPFFQVVPRKSGELEVMTPAVGGSNSFLAMAMMGGVKGGAGKDVPLSEIAGSFTLITDGEILVNNSKDGYQSSGDTKTIRWNVKDITESPRALIRLK